MALFSWKKDKKAEEAAAPAQQAADTQSPEEPKKKKGLFSRLVEGLTRSRENVGGRVEELVESTGVIDEDFYEELTDILIMADLGVKTTDAVIEELKERVEAEKTKAPARARDFARDSQKQHFYAASAAQVADGDAGSGRERRGQDDHDRQACAAL